MNKKIELDKDKILNFLKKNLIYFIAFILPIIMIIGYVIYREIITKGNFFFNGESFLVGDMHQQYTSIYSYIWDIFHGNASVIYSLNKELGSEMLTTLFYYAASPFNLLYVFFEKTDIPLVTFIIYLFKIGLCSLFACIFFNYKFGKKNSNLIFSLLYAFCSYCIVFYFHSMWLDVVYMAPLVLVGIEKLIKGKPLMYIITLSLSIIFNFYIGYMLCIFCVMYFLYELFIIYKFKDFRKYKKIVLHFIISSLIAVGISMFILLPVASGLQNVSRIAGFNIRRSGVYVSQIDFMNAVKQNFIYRLGFESYSPNDILNYTTKLYTGLFTLILVILYFFNKKIKKKEKILSSIILLMFILSFIFTFLFVVWHGFTLPGGYAGRHTFLFSLFLLILAAKSYNNLEKFSKKYIFVTMLIVSFGIYLFLNDQNPFYKKKIIINFIIILIYLIFIYIISKHKKNKFLKLTLFGMIVIELFANYKYGIMTKHESNIAGEFSTYQKEVCSTFNSLSKDFYRIDGADHFGYLDSLMCNMKSVSSIITTNNKKYIKFWKKNGENSAPLGTYYNTNRLPVLDSILGVKYVYENREQDEDDYYYKFYKFKSYGRHNIFNNRFLGKNVYIYENPYALNVGFIIPKNYKKIYSDEKSNNGLASLNRLFKTLSGSKEDILIEYPRKVVEPDSYEFYINNEEEYVYFVTDYVLIQTVDGDYQSDMLRYGDYIIAASNENNNGIVKVENNFPNQKIDIHLERRGISTSKPKTLHAYWFDFSVFEKSIEKMKKNQIYNTIIKKNKIYGDIYAKKDSVLFMSIPYDKNWKVYVDGKETKYEKIADFFMGIKLKKGNHKIKMVYKSKALTYGMLISIVSLSLLIINIMISRKKRYV